MTFLHPRDLPPAPVSLPAVEVVNLGHVAEQDVLLTAQDRGQVARDSRVVHLRSVALRIDNDTNEYDVSTVYARSTGNIALYLCFPWISFPGTSPESTVC